MDHDADADEWNADECEEAPADAWTIISDRHNVRGKRAYRCDQCARTLAAGDTMHVVVTRYEGEFHTTRTCATGCDSRGVEASELDWRERVQGNPYML